MNLSLIRLLSLATIIALPLVSQARTKDPSEPYSSRNRSSMNPAGTDMRAFLDQQDLKYLQEAIDRALAGYPKALNQRLKSVRPDRYRNLTVQLCLPKISVTLAELPQYRESCYGKYLFRWEVRNRPAGIKDLGTEVLAAGSLGCVPTTEFEAVTVLLIAMYNALVRTDTLAVSAVRVQKLYTKLMERGPWRVPQFAGYLAMKPFLPNDQFYPGNVVDFDPETLTLKIGYSERGWLFKRLYNPNQRHVEWTVVTVLGRKLRMPRWVVEGPRRDYYWSTPRADEIASLLLCHV